MSITNIFIARHGETEYNRLNQIQGRSIDVPLNETGRLQAQAIAEELMDKEINYIFSSSLRRSMETAEIIAWKYRKEYNFYPELDEMDFGHFEGKPADKIKEDLDKIHGLWKEGDIQKAPDGGESPADVLQRIHSRVYTLIEEYQGLNLLFILHGRSIRILLAKLLDYGLPNMHKVGHSNGALYHLKWNGEEYLAEYINKTEHLKNWTGQK